ncbi:sodium:solute symporter [candidate division KSB1 bacterium]|nr:sodium:solute symporter [candidate division KSB1 bacterium]
MTLRLIDWLIVVLSMIGLVALVRFSRHFMRSVTDFLSAGRSAGRYLLSVSQGMSALGSITIVGMWEMNYVAGFSLRWWEFTMGVVLLAITVSGWVIYRFRQTRALTVAQFFEIRYSRRFRIFAGLLAFTSGIVNFGIFPAVGARFFIYFCGLPESLVMGPFALPMLAVVMAIFLSIALYFLFAGGQIAVMLTEFVQGIFVNAVFILIVIYFLVIVDWAQILAAVSTAPPDASLINPYHTSRVKDFNLWYFLIGVVGVIYGKMSWQGTQAYNSSARTAHEAKMGEVLGNLRDIPKWLMLVFVPVIAYTVLHHPAFSAPTGAVESVLSGVDSEALRSQLRVPLVLRELLPVGFMGALATVMLMATIGTHDSYLHSWGSIFVQDVVMPFRKRPFAPEQHLRVLRGSIVGVCVFIFLFSLVFQQSEYIFLFFAITGAIFTGGSGAVIIGGLYWKRGTTPAAWSALITGSTIAVGGIVIHQLDSDFFINGQMFWGIAMAVSSLVYVLVSLFDKRPSFDMDSLLHRGAHAIAGETRLVDEVPQRGLRMLGMGQEFTRGDKLIYLIAYAWTAVWTMAFLAGSYFNLTGEVSDSAWLTFWRTFILVNVAASLLIIVWFTVGGLRDLKEMLRLLRTMKRDHGDDGFVRRAEERE